MAKFQVIINGAQREIEAPTGDYRLVAAMAVALADEQVPCLVKIWCDNLLPDYGPYWYRVGTDLSGNLYVKST